MTENSRADSAARPRGPAIVVPTNKVTVALPFSKITVEEPNKELAELAVIVAELATLVEAAAPELEATQLCLRAQAWPRGSDNPPAKQAVSARAAAG